MVIDRKTPRSGTPMPKLSVRLGFVAKERALSARLVDTENIKKSKDRCSK